MSQKYDVFKAIQFVYFIEKVNLDPGLSVFQSSADFLKLTSAVCDATCSASLFRGRGAAKPFPASTTKLLFTLLRVDGFRD